MNSTMEPATQKDFLANRISKEAQILSLANTFENLTSLKPGKALMTPATSSRKTETASS